MPSGIAKGGTYRLWLPSESARYHCEAVVYKCALRILRDLIQSTCSSKFSYIFPCIRCIQCIPNNLLHFIVCIMFSILNILFQYRTSLNQSLRSKLSCPVFFLCKNLFFTILQLFNFPLNILRCSFRHNQILLFCLFIFIFEISGFFPYLFIWAEITVF